MADNGSRSIWDLFNEVTSDAESTKEGCDESVESDHHSQSGIADVNCKKESQAQVTKWTSEQIKAEVQEDTPVDDDSSSQNKLLLPAISSLKNKFKLPTRDPSPLSNRPAKQKKSPRKKTPLQLSATISDLSSDKDTDCSVEQVSLVKGKRGRRWKKPAESEGFTQLIKHEKVESTDTVKQSPNETDTTCQLKSLPKRKRRSVYDRPSPKEATSSASGNLAKGEEQKLAIKSERITPKKRLVLKPCRANAETVKTSLRFEGNIIKDVAKATLELSSQSEEEPCQIPKPGTDVIKHEQSVFEKLNAIAISSESDLDKGGKSDTDSVKNSSNVAKRKQTSRAKIVLPRNNQGKIKDAQETEVKNLAAKLPEEDNKSECERKEACTDSTVVRCPPCQTSEVDNEYQQLTEDSNEFKDTLSRDIESLAKSNGQDTDKPEQKREKERSLFQAFEDISKIELVSSESDAVISSSCSKIKNEKTSPVCDKAQLGQENSNVGLRHNAIHSLKKLLSDKKAENEATTSTAVGLKPESKQELSPQTIEPLSPKPRRISKKVVKEGFVYDPIGGIKRPRRSVEKSLEDLSVEKSLEDLSLEKSLEDLSEENKEESEVQDKSVSILDKDKCKVETDSIEKAEDICTDPHSEREDVVKEHTVTVKDKVVADNKELDAVKSVPVCEDISDSEACKAKVVKGKVAVSSQVFEDISDGESKQISKDSIESSIVKEKNADNTSQDKEGDESLKGPLSSHTSQSEVSEKNKMLDPSLPLMPRHYSHALHAAVASRQFSAPTGPSYICNQKDLSLRPAPSPDMWRVHSSGSPRTISPAHCHSASSTPPPALHFPGAATIHQIPSASSAIADKTEDIQPLDLTKPSKRRGDSDGPLDLSVKRPQDEVQHRDNTMRMLIGRVAPFQSSHGILENTNRPQRKVSPVRPHIRGVPVSRSSAMCQRKKSQDMNKRPLSPKKPAASFGSPTPLVVNVVQPDNVINPPDSAGSLRFHSCSQGQSPLLPSFSSPSAPTSATFHPSSHLPSQPVHPHKPVLNVPSFSPSPNTSPGRKSQSNDLIPRRKNEGARKRKAGMSVNNQVIKGMLNTPPVQVQIIEPITVEPTSVPSLISQSSAVISTHSSPVIPQVSPSRPTTISRSPGSTKKYLHLREKSPSTTSAMKSLTFKDQQADARSETLCSSQNRKREETIINLDSDSDSEKNNLNNNGKSDCQSAVVNCKGYQKSKSKKEVCENAENLKSASASGSKESAFIPTVNTDVLREESYFSSSVYYAHIPKREFAISQTKYFQNVVNEGKSLDGAIPAKRRRLSSQDNVPSNIKGTWREKLYQHKRSVFKLPEKLLHVPRRTKPGFKADVPSPPPDKAEVVSVDATMQIPMTSLPSPTPPSSTSSKLSQSQPEPSTSKEPDRKFENEEKQLSEDVQSHVPPITIKPEPEDKPLMKMTKWKDSDMGMTEEARGHMCAIIDLVGSGMDTEDEKSQAEEVCVKQEPREDMDITVKSEKSNNPVIEEVCQSVDDVTNSILEVARRVEEQMGTLKKKRRRRRKGTTLSQLIASVSKSISAEKPDYSKMCSILSHVDKKETKKSSVENETDASDKEKEFDSDETVIASPPRKGNPHSPDAFEFVRGNMRSNTSPKKGKLLTRPALALRPIKPSSGSPKINRARNQMSPMSPGSPRRRVSPSKVSPRGSPMKRRSPNGKKLSKIAESKKQAAEEKRRKRCSMLKELENSDGYVAEKRMKKETTDLYADPSQLDREARMLQHYMMQFSQMEAGPEKTAAIKAHAENENRKREKAAADKAQAVQEKRTKDMKRAKAQKLKNKALGKKTRVAPCCRRRPHGFVDFKPVVLPHRTRRQSAVMRGASTSSYHKDDAYEKALEREELRLEEFRSKRQEFEDVMAIFSETVVPVSPEPLPEIIKTPKLVKSVEKKTAVSTEKKREYSASKGKGKGKRSLGSSPAANLMRPLIEIVKGDDSEDSNTLYAGTSAGGVHRSLYSRADTMLLPSTDAFRDDDAMSTATNTSFDSAGGRLYVPPEVKKLSVNKDTGETIMHKVARLGKEDIALWLCQTGYVDYKKADHAGYTGLHESSATGHVNISRILLEYGLDVNAASRIEGIRPLHDAIENDHIEMARLLLSYGADPSISTYSGKTLNSMIKSPEMKEFLQAYKIDLNGPRSVSSGKRSGKENEVAWIIDDFHVEEAKEGSDSEEDVIGFDVLAGAPHDQDADDFEMLFDLSVEETIPLHHLRIDEAIGHVNYALIPDILTHLLCTKEVFERNYPCVDIQYITWQDLATQMQSYTIPVPCPAMPTTENARKQHVGLVQWMPQIKRILGVTEERVPRTKKSNLKGNLQLIDAKRALQFGHDNQGENYRKSDGDRCFATPSKTKITPKKSSSRKSMTSPMTSARKLVTSTPKNDVICISDCDNSAESGEEIGLKIEGVCSLNTDAAETIFGSRLPFTPPRAPPSTE